MFSFKRRRSSTICIGDCVRIRQLRHCPQAGDVGTVTKVSPLDVCGQYMVRFKQGQQFLYVGDELEVINLNLDLRSASFY